MPVVNVDLIVINEKKEFFCFHGETIHTVGLGGTFLVVT